MGAGLSFGQGAEVLVEAPHDHGIRRTSAAGGIGSWVPMVAAAFLLLPFAAGAQVGPVGSQFQVNSYTVGGQFYFSAAGAADGAFVVAWSSGQNDGDVFGRRYDSAGQPVGTDFQINSHTMGYTPTRRTTNTNRWRRRERTERS